MDWSGCSGALSFIRRDSNQFLAGRKLDGVSEAELELLIAKYTLEYRSHWTNNFNPTAWAQLKEMFGSADNPTAILHSWRLAGGAQPN
jgi:hypothetical protein